MNLLRVLLRSVCGSHPSDVPPKSKISVQIEQNGNGRRSGAFLHISFKNSSICKAFGVRQRPPQGAEFVCVPCGANNSKSTASDGVPVRVRPPAPKFLRPRVGTEEFFVTVGLEQNGGPQAAKKHAGDMFFSSRTRSPATGTKKGRHAEACLPFLVRSLCGGKPEKGRGLFARAPQR